jgi:DNA-binding transcriptional MerR regulator
MGEKQKAILLSGFTNSEIKELLNCYKANKNLPKDIIFATVTETALDWKVKDWLKELEAEHAEFKKLNSKK